MNLLLLLRGMKALHSKKEMMFMILLLQIIEIEKMMLMLMLMLHTGPVWADDAAPSCDGVTMEIFEVADETAAQMLMDMDFAPLAAYEDVILRNLACLSEPITGSAAASVYGMVAMSALVDPQRGETEVRAALYAAGLAWAGYTLPSIMPSTHKLRVMNTQAADFSGAYDSMTPHEGSTIVVDGVTARPRRIGAPTIVQIQTDGEISSTVYLAPAVAFHSGGGDAQH